jgi:hypothetical protein
MEEDQVDVMLGESLTGEMVVTTSVTIQYIRPPAAGSSVQI